jgi:putative DNA primase/helicase
VGDTHEPKQFSVWAPKAFAGINLPKHFSEATMSRGIVINMRRKLANESIVRIRRTNKADFEVLKLKLARFAQDYAERIRHAQIDLPDELSDRDQDNWEPLLTIAQCAGNEWLTAATEAALNLSKSENVLSINTELLSDIREIFAAHHEGKMSSADVIETLVKDTEAPWATWNHGKPFSARQLTKLLEPYGIKTKNLKFGLYNTLKGFELAQFEDAFARYLAPADLRNDEPKGYIFVYISVQPKGAT